MANGANLVDLPIGPLGRLADETKASPRPTNWPRAEHHTGTQTRLRMRQENRATMRVVRS